MTNLDVEQDWREVLASKASKWNKKSRRLSHLTISKHSPPPSSRLRSPAEDNLEEMETDDGSSWSETESTVSTGFSRSLRSKSTTLSGMCCVYMFVALCLETFAARLSFHPRTSILGTGLLVLKSPDVYLDTHNQARSPSP